MEGGFPLACPSSSKNKTLWLYILTAYLFILCIGVKQIGKLSSFKLYKVEEWMGWGGKGTRWGSDVVCIWGGPEDGGWPWKRYSYKVGDNEVGG